VATGAGARPQLTLRVVLARAPVRALLVTAPCRRTAARQQTGIARLLALFRHTGAALLLGQLTEAGIHPD